MGSAYTRQLAARGLNVVVVADAAHPPDEIARRLAAEHGVETRAVTADLAATDVLVPIEAATRDLDVGLLSTTPPHRSSAVSSTCALRPSRMVDVNCRGSCYWSIIRCRMRNRGRGGSLMSSLAAFQGQAMVATSRRHQCIALVLGEWLWDELSDHGIDLLAFCPRDPTPELRRHQAAVDGVVSAPVMEPEDTWPRRSPRWARTDRGGGADEPDRRDGASTAPVATRSSAS